MKQKTMFRLIMLLCIVTAGIAFSAPHFFLIKNECTATASEYNGSKKDASGRMFIWQLLYQHLLTFN